MPLDPDIPFRALAGMQRAQPYDPLAVQEQIDRSRVYQAQAQKAQQEMQSQQRLQQLAQQYGDDPDELVKQLGSVDPMLAQKLGEQIGQARYAGAQAHLEQTKSAEAEIDSWQRLLQSTDDKTWGAVRTAAVQKMPQLASVLPAEYSDHAKQQALALGMSAKDWAKVQSDASQLYLDGKHQEAAASLIAGADNPQKRAIAEDLLKQSGLGKLSQMWKTPQDAQAFLANNPEGQKLALDVKKEARAEQHQTTQEGFERQRIGLEGARVGMERQRLSLDQQKRADELKAGGVGVKLPAATAQVIAGLDQSVSLIDELKTLKKDEWLGPFAGRATEAKIALPGVTVPDDLAKFAAQTATLKNSVIKAITGAQMSEPEANRILAQVPVFTDKPNVWLQKAEETQKNAAAMRKRIIALSGGSEPDEAPTTTTKAPASGKRFQILSVK